MSEVCSACLSVDRRLVSVKTLHFILQWIDIKFNMDEDLVCWECRALLTRIHTFRAQVGKAQKTLRLLRHMAMPLRMHLSKLSVNTKSTYDAVYYEEIVKEELNDLSFECNDSDTTAENNVGEIGPNICVTKVIKEDISLEDIVKNLSNNTECMKLSKEEKKFAVERLTYEDMLKTRDMDKNGNRYKVCSHKCTKCIKAFFSEQKYKKHIEDKHSVKIGKHMCSICEVRFTRKSALQYHYDCHFRSYRCKLCEFTHHRLNTMQIHLTKEHEKEKIHMCYVCKQVFDTPGSLRYHSEVSHKELPKCDLCGKTCKTKYSLKMHLLWHKGGLPLLQCQQCGGKYSGRGGLRIHQLTHATAPDERAYCAECGVQYKRVYSYRQHLLTHSRHRREDALKYTCSHCDAKFKNKSELARHVTSKHLKDYPFTCHVCNKGFIRNCRLKLHVAEKHDGISQPKDKICTYCGKGFKTNQVLVKHIRTHTGERPYQCEHCSSKFSQRSALKTHVKALHLKQPKRHTS